MGHNHRCDSSSPHPMTADLPTCWWRLATPLPCARWKPDPRGSPSICQPDPTRHGRVLTVVWGRQQARGKRLA
jgi:hypothetical protein